ncbi:MAG: porin [Pseudomonadales bacterium]|nr:porin [Pseudomonadales bacterium]
MSYLSTRKTQAWMLLGVSAFSLANQASAADKELLDILLANDAITEVQHQQLLAQDELTAADVSHITMSSRGLEIASGNGDFEFNLGGRLHLDYFNHENQSGLPQQPASGTAVRRSRLEIDGMLDGMWGYAAEVDFANNNVSLKDIKIGYVGGDNWTLYAGQQKQPYSLALEMSSNDMPFVERSVDNALVVPFFDRATGIRLDVNGERWFFAGGIFGDSIRSGGSGDEGSGVMGRFVFSPIQTQNQTLHLGLRAGLRNTDDSETAQVRDKTTEFSGFSIVNTGLLNDVEQVTMFGPEFAWALGPFTVLGEYNKAEIKRDSLNDLSFDSFHVGATWSLTGEHRAGAYRIDSGEFKAVRPTQVFDPANGAWGGVELVARYGEIDLNDAGFVGGQVEEVNIGANWYLSSNMRLMFDWMHVLDTDESNLVRSIVPDMDIVTVRVQYNY